ncbi:hypothetical protein Daus18300_013751 [Diaporthe australafricana]|uniref:Rhodopsin domain-containing protein n=1 Tax=Diaporthe australafricana TaxID=127596 RepID=A0ABR3VXU7_9PEZI
MTYVTEASITAIGILFPCLAVICFALRIQSQRQYAKGIEIDGMLAIPAGILTIGAGIAVTVGAQIHVLGGHSLTAEADSKIAKFEYAFWPVHVWAMGLIKLSILFFFRRIFKGSLSHPNLPTPTKGCLPPPGQRAKV